MAKTISRYKVEFQADTGKYQRGLKSAGRSTGRFRKGVVGLSRGLAGGAKAIIAVGVAATAAGIAIATMLVKSGLKDVDRITKFAQTIGMSTEMLSALELSSTLAGSSAEGLKTGLLKLQDVFSDAVSGGQASIDKFNDIGLSVSDLAKMSADDRLFAISDAMAALPGPVAQSRAAIDLFGKSGTELVLLLTQGSDALKAQGVEATKLGIVFDRHGAAKVEMANDAMARMAAISQGLGRTMAIELAPFIQATAEKLTSMATEGRTMSDIVVDGMEWVATGIGKVADWLELLKAGWFGLQAVATGVITGLVLVLEGLAKGIDFVSEALGLGSTGIGDTMEMLRQELDDTTVGLAEKTAEAWQRFNDGANTKEVGEFFDDVRQRADDAADSIANAAEERNALAIAASEEQERREKEEQEQAQNKSPAAQDAEQASATVTAFLVGSASAAINKAENNIEQKAQETRERSLEAIERVATAIEAQEEWSFGA